MVERVRESQQVIKSYGEGQSIIEIRPLLLLHTTLNYFCCHTAQVSPPFMWEQGPYTCVRCFSQMLSIAYRRKQRWWTS